eukprot:jgi/Mesvir1/14217/Mv09668-RA.1
MPEMATISAVFAPVWARCSLEIHGRCSRATSTTNRAPKGGKKLAARSWFEGSGTIAFSRGLAPSTGHRQPCHRCKNAGSVVRCSSAKMDVPRSTKEFPANLTYLENNGWLWDIGSVKVLVDPWLEGDLDFGVPYLYSAKKRSVRWKVADLPADIDLLLITQGFEDHAHKATLTPLSRARPNLPVIAPPNAKGILGEMAFKDITYVSPGEEIIFSKGAVPLSIRATTGALLGPPWQQKENGYIVSVTQPSPFSLYVEPHCMYEDDLKNFKVDAVITPVVRQMLPLDYPLVDGMEKAKRLAQTLRAKYVIPMANGDLISSGPLDKIIKVVGSNSEFELLLKGTGIQVLVPVPGKPLSIPAA